MHILYAERFAMVRDALRPFILGLDTCARLTEVECAEQLWGEIRNGPAIDLLILDCDLPGIDLEDCIESLSNLHPQGRVVLLSSKTTRPAIADTLILKTSGFIPKRMSVPAFMSALSLVMAGERYIPAILIQEKMLHGGVPAHLDEDDFGCEEEAPALPRSDTRLTLRQREVLGLLREGHPNKVIARRLNMSEVTVKSHLSQVFRKLGVQNRVQAARLGYLPA